ncbi:nucleolar pre-ribosomal-associated protein 1 [Euwallacea similis]|uniref:nucleolar pre-ribosomal-associated protein 1 n=1 Tax=Euwallacea similis TaxID=1736056 RepID=UPI00344FB48F
METEQPPQKKRALKVFSSEEEPKLKKAKSYSVKHFRKQLQTAERLNGLKEFSTILSDNPKHDYILDYLKDGGNCLELLQSLEGDSSIPPSIVFNLITCLLLAIATKYGQYYNSAYESCRYLINNYLPVIHKMVGLSSSKEERMVCLKLLTAMATFSSNLAKDILINVKFHSANIELLTKHTGEKNNVRDCFIHFLTAFLVERDWHVLPVLLEKSFLLTSIIPGLQHDNSDTVCVIITAMKNHILENPLVTKTTKMHIFNTAVVKDIVNLYNWKGLEGLKALEKGRKSVVFEVDKVAKSNVSECVHDFLLVLCTSNKYGLIFRDHMVGLGRKNQNPLIYTVLDSLDRPWDHSYASDLVIKICRSCPDLTKNMWLILKPYLEPRLTEKWLNAMSFANKLIAAMEPECIDYCIKELSSHQVAQIIEILVSPSPIIKTLLDVTPEEKIKVSSHIIQLLCHMLEQMNKFTSKFKIFSNTNNFLKLSNSLANYIAKNYPTADKLLQEWTSISSSEEDVKQKENNLKAILDILSLYKTISPQLLSNLTSITTFDFKDFFFNLPSLESIEDSEALQIKLVSLFIDTDKSLFLPNTEIFNYIIPVLLQNYHENKEASVEAVLKTLLKNTGIFDGNGHEIHIWLNGIFNFSALTESFAKDFLEAFNSTSEHLLEYQKELVELILTDDCTDEHQELIEELLSMSEDQDPERKLKRKLLSPAILGFLKYLKQNPIHSKNNKKYLEVVLLNLFHSQTSWHKDRLNWFKLLVEKEFEVIPSNVLNYVRNWTENRLEPLGKMRGSLEFYKDIGNSFFNGKIEEDLLKDCDFFSDVLNMTTFYFSNLVASGLVREQHCKNWQCLVDYIADCKYHIDAEYCWELVLENPCLINHFRLINPDCSMAIMTLLKVFKNLSEKRVESVNCFKQHYSHKIFLDLKKFLKDPKNDLRDNIEDFLTVFPLSYHQCRALLVQISLVNKTSEQISMTFNKLLVYCLRRIAELCKLQPNLKPLDKDLLQILTTFINSSAQLNPLAEALKSYLEVFPHCIADIDKDVFSSLLVMPEYNKDCVDLVIFVVQRDLSTIAQLQNNLVAICQKKGFVLPLVQVLLRTKFSEGLLKDIYHQLEPSILKAIQKPQKVGQHFMKGYDVDVLIEKFMPLEKCASFADKMQKFEAFEVFHAKLFAACVSKALDTLNNKQICNVLGIFVNINLGLLKRKLESDADLLKIDGLAQIFTKLLDKITCTDKLEIVNESFKSFCKFSLKFGVSGHFLLLNVLQKLLKIAKLFKEDAEVLLDMLLSHSEFLNVTLGESSETKLEILKLFLVLCETWTELMDKSHMPILLSAYRGLISRCDRTVLILLKLYESKSEQTSFYDFKPFLIGRPAATHYSVRTQIASSLNRQPKISDVLGMLKEDLVNSTITNFPLTDSLRQSSEEKVVDLKCYDLKFFLPLFSHILAPEQQVKTYIFIRSGALSLTVLGLACQDKEVRQASCHVLCRLHFHLEARQAGKDNLLWIRYVEALCKGVALLPNFKLNSFSAIFFARMALVLTNPKHLMFPPLSLYLTAKPDLDLSTIPELYTLLFSSDVNFKEHRNFILEILRDGLKNEKDFLDFLKSMAYKLFSELYSSCLSDADCRLLILDILEAACKIPLGVKMLVENNSLLPQLSFIVSSLCAAKDSQGLSNVLEILLIIAKSRDDKHQNREIFGMCRRMLESKLDIKNFNVFYELLFVTYLNSPDILQDKLSFIDKLISSVNDRFCNYLREFGCSFVSENCLELTEDHRLHFLRRLVYRILLVS